MLLDQGRLQYERSPIRGIVEDTLVSRAFPTYIDNLDHSDSDDTSTDGESPEEEKHKKSSHPLLSKQLAGEDTTIKHIGKDEAENPLLECKIAMSSYQDISSTMYRRALLDYGMVPSVNQAMIGDAALKTVWKWVSWSTDAASQRKLLADGIDFSFEGCLNIWNGTAGQSRKSASVNNKDYLGAIEKINMRFDADIFPKSVIASPQRQLALAATGWCMTTAEFDEFQENLLLGNEHAKAAFYAVAQSRNIEGAIDIMKLAGTQMEEAVSDFLDARGDDDATRAWRDACPDRGVELDSPYIRGIFAYLTAKDWRDVIDEQGLTLRERVSLSLRYLRDEEVGPILQDLCRTETAEGNLEGLLLTGINLKSLELLQAYVNRTADVQTAALLTSFKPVLRQERSVQEWVHEYRTFLMCSGLTLQRCKFDVARTKLAHSAGVIKHSPSKHILIRCNHCNAVMQHNKYNNESLGRSADENNQRFTGVPRQLAGTGTVKNTLCSNCRKPLPRCVLCLLSVGRDDLLCLCLTCNHTLHESHATEWFRAHTQCPAPQCKCECRVGGRKF